MKRKIFAMLLCVALTFAIFGTLAVGAEENVTLPSDPATQEAEPAKDPAPVCNCTPNEDGTHAETCDLYVAPKEEPQEQPKEEVKEEPKDETNVETKNLEKPAHIEGCSDECDAENCDCICHVVAEILATTNEADFIALAESLTQEQFAALNDDQIARIKAHGKSLEPVSAPAVVPATSQPPVESEVYVPTRNVTNAAPLGEPVTGK